MKRGTAQWNDLLDLEISIRACLTAMADTTPCSRTKRQNCG